MNLKNSVICLVLLVVAACSLQKSLYKNDTTIKELRENVNSTVSNWDTVLSVADISYEDTKSYIPESGIRGRYEQYKKYLGISILEKVVGEKVFLSGPHSAVPNYTSQDQFGRYNPLFLKKLDENLQFLFKNKTFVKNIQSHYDSKLKQYLRVYYLSYKVAANNKEVMDGYLDAIANPEKHDYRNGRIKGPSYYLQESFRDFAEGLEKEGYDVYEAFTCPAFWVRRSIDGTADEFYEVLKLTLKTFDPEFTLR
jgi:hypothetical protein